MTRESSESQRRRKPKRRYAAPKQGGSVMPWIFGGGLIALCVIAFAMPREAQEPKREPVKDDTPNQGQIPDKTTPAAHLPPRLKIEKTKSDPPTQTAGADPEAAKGPGNGSKKPISGDVRRSAFIETILAAEGDAKRRASLEELVAQQEISKTLDRAEAEGIPLDRSSYDEISNRHREYAKACVRMMIAIAKAGRANGLTDDGTMTVIKLIDTGTIPIGPIPEHEVDDVAVAYVLQQKDIESAKTDAKKAVERAFGGK